jgi:tetratricopeptide (TPR) repeat protein
MRAQGESQEKAGRIAEAVSSYRECLRNVPDATLEQHVKALEAGLAEAGGKKAAADKLWQEGTALLNQGRPSDALTKFKESLGYWSEATRTKYVSDLEARRAKAVALRTEGAKLQQGNRVPEAIAKYKESQNYWSDPGLSSHIATLEGKQKQDADTAARKAKARQLRDEGYALQQKKQLQAAIGKYKESLAIWPDQELENYIRQLEAKIAAVPTSPPGGGTPSGSAAPLAGSWTANFNNYRGPFTIRSDGSATLDIGNGVETITDLRFDASSGRITFTRMLKHVGPQHKQVYTGRLVREGFAEGSFDCTASGKGFPWKIERTAKAGTMTSSSTSSTQKPGGTPAETGTGRWAGTWKSDPGPDGEVVTFNLSQSGSRLTGTFQVDVPYTAATGARQKETLRGTIEGTASGNRATGTFREGSDKGATGTFEFNMASGGNVFTAAVRGEDTSDTYTVRRGGSSASAGSSVSSGQSAPRAVTAELTNHSRENAHIFTDGETFGPANRLAPGEKRKVAVSMKADGSVTFRAGRNGQVMATKTWRGTPGDSTRVPVVVFDDTNPYDKLTVTTGLR